LLLIDKPANTEERIEELKINVFIVVLIFIFGLFYIFVANYEKIHTFFTYGNYKEYIPLFHDMRMGFVSVVIETLPFLLVGSLLASLILILVPQKIFVRLAALPLPLQMLLASCIGLIFPICDCAIIPVARSLMKKGLPVPTAVVLMLATPIVDPITIASTHFAFKMILPSIVLYRLLFGILVALIIGLTFIRTKREEALKDDAHDTHCPDEPAHGHSCSCSEHEPADANPFKTTLHVIRHTKDEFFSMGAFLVLGAAVSTLIYFLVPNSIMLNLTQNELLSIPVFGLFGYAISLCATADAFVIAPFANGFSMLPLLSFLVISPLIDIKNTLILFSMFKKKFALRLIILIFVLVFSSLILLSIFTRGSV
jgi:uncharacterized protein